MGIRITRIYRGDRKAGHRMLLAPQGRRDTFPLK